MKLMERNLRFGLVPLLFFLASTQLLAQGMAPACLTLEEGKVRACSRLVEADSECRSFSETYAFIPASCRGDEELSGIEAINQRIAAGESMDSIFEQYPINQVATALVHRFYLRNLLPFTSDADWVSPNFSYFRDGKIQIALREGLISSVLERGFLNQHQTSTTNGSRDPHGRNRTENILIDRALEQSYSSNRDAIIHKLRPKYAYWVPTKKISSAPHVYSRQYGNVFFALKDRVKRRSTLTNIDSLWINQDNTYTQPPAAANLYQYFRSNPERRAVTPMTSGFHSSNFTLVSKGSYSEAQIWGTLDFSDVEYAMINCPNQDRVSTDAINVMREKIPQIPIYSCTAVVSDGVYIYQPKDLLHGTPQNLDELSER